MVSKQLLDKIGMRIPRPSKTELSTAAGTSYRPIGEIDDLPIQIEDQTILTAAYVVDTEEYDVIVSIGWLRQIQTVLDLVNIDFTSRHDGVLISTPLLDQERLNEV